MYVTTPLLLCYRKANNRLALIDAVDAMSIQTSGTLLPSYSSVQVNQVPSPSSAPAQSTESIDEAVARAVNSHFNSAQFTEKLQETVRTEVEKQTPPPPSPAPVPTVNPDVPATGTLSVLPDPASFFQNASGFAIYCNNCSNNIKGVHYHCQQCDSGDFDLCKKCTDQGVHCNDQRHWLMYRELLDDGRVTWNGEGVYAKTKDVEKPEEKDVLMRLCNSCGHGTEYLLFWSLEYFTDTDRYEFRGYCQVC